MDEATLEHKKGKVFFRLTRVLEVKEPLQKPVRTGVVDAELKFFQHFLFHLQNFLSLVRIICDVDEVRDDRRVDLLILGCN